MDRVASLLKSARELRRHLFASLPMRVRLAALILVLANANAEAWGKFFYALFLTKGVKGMPDIRGQDALEWYAALPDSKKQVKIMADKLLPPGYGSKFGHSIYKFALMIAKRPDKVDDELQSLSEYVLKNELGGLQEGSSLSRAENYIIHAVQNRTYNILTRQKREQQRNESMSPPDDDDKQTKQYTDRVQQELHDQKLELHELLESPKTHLVLNRVHPDAMTFIEKFLEGYDVKEIVGDPKHGEPGLLPHFNRSQQAGFNFIKTYIPKIYAALQQIAGTEGIALDLA